MEYFCPLLAWCILPIMYPLNKNKFTFSLICMVFIPFLADITFIRSYVSFFFCLLMSSGTIYLLRDQEFKQSSTVIIVFVLVTTSTILPHFVSVSNSSSNYTRTSNYLDESTYNSGIYYEENLDGNLVSNDGQLGRRLFALTGEFVLQYSGTPSYYAYGFIDSNVTSQIIVTNDFSFFELVSEDPTNVIFKIDDWLGSGNWYSQLHASKLYQTNLDSERNKLFVDYYDLKYAVIFSPDLDLDEIQTIGGTTSASFFQ